MVASCAAECTATGDGLQQATPREEARFTIIARDAAGQPRRVGGELFKLLFRGASSPTVEQRDMGDGTYECSYLLVSSGKYELTVLLGGERIQGSPFKVAARMPGAAPHLCTASGEGLRTARAGAPPRMCFVLLA